VGAKGLKEFWAVLDFYEETLIPVLENKLEQLQTVPILVPQINVILVVDLILKIQPSYDPIPSNRNQNLPLVSPSSRLCFQRSG
jgi:hypothetical protein